MSRADRTLAKGRYGTVEYAVRENGSMEAKDWLEDQAEGKQASFGVLFERLVNEGISNKTQYRKLKDQVWEFKRSGDRLLCYHLGSRTLLTHHLRKGGSKKTPKKEIRRAENIGEEHIAWETGGGDNDD